ncbi:MAG: hypothetical protein WC701_06645 [Kiritimatiellales bacterium]|jgi:transposase-like protein
MQERNIAELRCKYCNSADVVKAGTRKLRSGVKQLYKCSGCLRKFSNLNRNAKQTDPEIILKSLILVCRGYSYEQASRFILRKHQKLISTSVISKWVKEYNPPYLRRMLKVERDLRARSSVRGAPAPPVAAHDGRGNAVKGISQVSGTAFLKYNGIRFGDQTRSYPAVWQDGMLIISLN